MTALCREWTTQGFHGYGRRLSYHNQGGYLRTREVTAVWAACATPAIGLEVREFGPIQTPRHEDTVYLPATTVPPSVFALRPERAETVAQAQFLRKGIDPGRHQPMQRTPFMLIKSPNAIISRRGGVTVPRAARCTRRVASRQPSPAAPSRARQPGPPWSPRVAARRVRYASPVARAEQRDGPVVPVPASPSHRQPLPPALPPPAGCRVPRRL